MPIQPTTFSSSFPDHIDWLYANRQTAPLRQVVNMNVMMFTCMFVEGTLEYVFRRAIRKDVGLDAFADLPSVNSDDRMRLKVDAEIRRINGWSGCWSMFSTIFGTKIGDEIAGDTLEAVDVLFSLRGAIIAHGRAANFVTVGPLQPQNNPVDFEWESGVFSKVDAFIKKKGLPRHMDGEIPEVGWWFSDEMTDYAFEMAVGMIVEIGLLPSVSANLFWNTDNGKTMDAINARLNGRLMPTDR
ncbi:MAG: hypothetical protein AAF921_04785 [Cyanobacteria bacterium P01_D01_bin.44]